MASAGGRRQGVTSRSGGKLFLVRAWMGRIVKQAHLACCAPLQPPSLPAISGWLNACGVAGACRQAFEHKFMRV